MREPNENEENLDNSQTRDEESDGDQNVESSKSGERGPSDFTSNEKKTMDRSTEGSLPNSQAASTHTSPGSKNSVDGKGAQLDNEIDQDLVGELNENLSGEDDPLVTKFERKLKEAWIRPKESRLIKPNVTQNWIKSLKLKLNCI